MAGKAVSKKDQDKAMALPDDLKLPDGAGLEDADKDSYAIPFLVILQKMSPACDEGEESYVEGAKPGMFYNTVSGELYDPAEDENLIIPVFYRRAFVEWKTREEGGGFIGEHAVDEAVKMNITRDSKNRDMLDNGNQIVDTRYHYVILVRKNEPPQPMVITMASTQVKKSKKLCSDMDTQMRTEGLRATFQLMYKIETVGESNEHGSWRGWHITRAGKVKSQDHLDAAISFYKAIKSGEVKEATDTLDQAGAAPSSNSEDSPEF